MKFLSLHFAGQTYDNECIHDMAAEEMQYKNSMRTNNNEKLIMSSLHVLSATVLCASVYCEAQIQCKTNSFEVIRCSFDIVARFLH